MSLKYLSLLILAFFILGGCAKTDIPQSVVTSTWGVVNTGSINNSIHIYPVIKSPKSEIAATAMNNWYFLNIDGFTNISGLLSAWEICESMSSPVEKCQEKYKKSITESTEKYSTLFQSNTSIKNTDDTFCVNIGSRIDAVWSFTSKTTVFGLAVGSQQGQTHSGALSDYPLIMNWRTEISDQFSPENEIVRFKDTNARYPQMKYIAATTPHFISDQLYFQSSGIVSWKKISTLANTQACIPRWSQNSILIHLEDYIKLWEKLPLRMRYKNIGETLLLHRKSETQTLLPQYANWLDSIELWTKDIPDQISKDWAGFYTVLFSSKTLENVDYIEILP